MTTHSTDYTTGASTESDASVKERAAEAAQQGKEAAGQVAQTAVGHAQEVKQEAVQQARDLVGEARNNVNRQVSTQHQNLVTNLRSISDELGSMVQGSEQRGTATELVSQARERVSGVAEWLDGKEPDQLLDELRSFARRRPGTFLLGALAAGVVAGRLTRGAVAAHTEDSGTNGSSASHNGQSYGSPAGYSVGGAYGQPAGQLTQPETGYGSPGTGYGSPGTGYGTPGTGYDQPGTGYGTPGTGYEAPGSGYGESGSGYGQPATGYGEPSTGYGESGSGYGSTTSYGEGSEGGATR
jgi:hypothetical protein